MFVFCCAALFFVILASISPRIIIRFYGGVFALKIKYLFFKLEPLKKKKPRKTRRKKAAKSRGQGAEKRRAGDTEQAPSGGGGAKRETADAKRETAGAEKTGEDGERDGAHAMTGLLVQLEKANELKDRYSPLLYDRKLKKLFNKAMSSVSFANLTLDFCVCGKDAYDAAMNYGRVNAAAFNAISAVRQLFPVSVKTIDILCDFDGKKSRFDGGVDIKIRLPSVIGAGVMMLIWFVKNKNRLLPPENRARKSVPASS